MPNQIPPCPHCNNRSTFSQQQRNSEDKTKQSTHSAIFFDPNGQPIERRRVLQADCKNNCPHYTYCTYCKKRRKNVYYSNLNEQIQPFNFPKQPFLIEHYEMYDIYHAYQYRDDRIEIAKQFGYQYISEATTKIYMKLKSINHTGRILKLSPYSIRSELNMMGIKRNGPGGWNKGTNMGGRTNPEIKKQYLKLINERLAA